MELMIVLTIIGVLAVIAIPAYSHYIQKGHRIEAKSGLMDIQLQQVQWRNNNTRYTTSDHLRIPISTYYIFSITYNDAISFTAIAVPAGVQADDACGTFQINLDGPDYADGMADSHCWGG